MADIKDNLSNPKDPQPKCVVFDENNQVQLAEEGRTILVFVMGEDGVKISLNGYVTEMLLTTLKSNMPGIMDNLITDFKKHAKEQETKNANTDTQTDGTNE